jgi:hypothetical protein
MSKLQTLARIEGMSTMEMLEQATFDSVAPGICKTPGCDYSTEVEPDCTEGWCEECDAGTVVSCLSLAGLI